MPKLSLRDLELQAQDELRREWPGMQFLQEAKNCPRHALIVKQTLGRRYLRHVYRGSSC